MVHFSAFLLLKQFPLQEAPLAAILIKTRLDGVLCRNSSGLIAGLRARRSSYQLQSTHAVLAKKPLLEVIYVIEIIANLVSGRKKVAVIAKLVAFVCKTHTHNMGTRNCFLL